MITPGSTVGFFLFNLVVPFVRGWQNESYIGTLLIAVAWGAFFVMYHGKQLDAEPGTSRATFLIFNLIFALPPLSIAFWLGRLIH